VVVLRILITGASGLLGSKLAQLAIRRGYEVYSGYNEHAPTYGTPLKFDASQREATRKAFEIANPATIVHAAALTDVDKCEVDRKLARAVNATGTRNVAEACRECGAKLVFISTDYVFDGVKGNYSENDQPNPINYYGISKLEGEKAVIESCNDYIIVRSSVIYGWIASLTSKSSSGKPLNFAMWLTNKLQNNEMVNIVTDQYSTPTLSDSLAQTILALCEKNAMGLYHITGRTRLSRFEFALKLAEKLNLSQTLINQIVTSQLKQVAKRPMDSSLKVGKIEETLGIKMLTIDEALDIYCKQEAGLKS